MHSVVTTNDVSVRQTPILIILRGRESEIPLGIQDSESFISDLTVSWDVTLVNDGGILYFEDIVSENSYQFILEGDCTTFNAASVQLLFRFIS